MYYTTVIKLHDIEDLQAKIDEDDQLLVIQVDPGEYFFKESIRFTRPVHFIGPGGRVNSTAVINFEKGGFVVDHPSTGIEGRQGEHSLIQGVRINGNPDSDAVALYQRARISDVGIVGAKRGIVVSDQKGNANAFWIEHTDVYWCDSHGIFCDGGDSNAGGGMMINLMHNKGWGIFDSSFLGNTWVACHTAANKMGAYKADNPNAPSVFVGCYSESGQPASQIDPPSLAVGGLHGAGVRGMYIDGTNSHDQKAIFYGEDFNTLIGSDGFGLNIRGKGDHPTGARWAYQQKAYALTHANLDSRICLAMTGEETNKKFGREHAVGPGNVFFPRGIFMDRHINFATGIPTAGEYAKGDVLFNSDPGNGKPVFWQCTKSGTPGTWKAFPERTKTFWSFLFGNG